MAPDTLTRAAIARPYRSYAENADRCDLAEQASAEPPPDFANCGIPPKMVHSCWVEFRWLMRLPWPNRCRWREW